MQFEIFISRHILKPAKSSLSGPSVRIAIASIAVGVAVMVSAVAILKGFRNEIREKVSGFSSHIRITRFQTGSPADMLPLKEDEKLLRLIRQVKGVDHVQSVAYKTGILKTEDQLHGVMLKGVGKDYDPSFLQSRLLRGSMPEVSDTVVSNMLLISKRLSDLMRLDTGDAARMYFLAEGESQPRARRFTVSGIYFTGLEDFDNSIALCDLRHIQRLNGWDYDQTGVWEIWLRDFEDIDHVTDQLYSQLPSDLDVNPIRETYPQIFDWLELQDMNVWVILALMTMVAAMAITSALFIIIVERTRMVGTLKALGAPNPGIRRIFLITASWITLKGMLWGNLAGLTLMGLQAKYRIIRLPVDSYYMEFVPVSLDLTSIVLINLLTLTLCLLMLIAPTVLITRISPLKAIRYN